MSTTTGANRHSKQESGAKRKRIEIIEKLGDLFAEPDANCLAHCISEDCRMGAGIAAQFAARFGAHDYRRRTKALEKSVGEIAVLASPDAKRVIYNLITKKHYYDKPTLATLVQTLGECLCLQS
jgi:hypothetical protein